jgi:xanthine dehydrogenase molybdenum-binding subunit
MAEINKKKELNIVGKDIPLMDSIEKVTGSLQFGVDVRIPDMVHGKILRSPHAHARIKNIDTERAESLPGVIGVVTHKDAPEWQWENCWYNYRGRILDDTVRYVGDEIAAIAAIDEVIAKAALNLIEVELEILDPVFDPFEAMSPKAPQVRSEGNVRAPTEVIWGDVDEGAKNADIVVQGSMSFGSQAYAPIGRNACTAQWKGDRVTVWTSTQTPSEMREAIAKGLGIPISHVRVIAQPCGSSFGLWWIGSLQLITVLLAKKAGRPVKIELDQGECFSAVKRRHLERSFGRLGCTNEGTISFIDVEHIHDNGGYGFKPDVGFLIVDLWGRCPHGRFIIQGVSTNLVTAGCMRGVGDVTLGAFVERLLDKAAIEIEMDPLEFRLKNHIRVNEPLRAVMKRDHDDQGSENFPDGWPELGHLSSEALGDCLTKGAEAFGWKEKWGGWGKPYLTDGSKARAVGVATGIHCCGTEDEYGSSAVIRVHIDGSATLCCSVGRQGQGSETTQAQIAAEALGLPIERIRVEAGDTDICPPNHGSIASNTAFRTGFATLSAALDAKKQILDIAAKHLPHLNPDDLDMHDGVIFSQKSPMETISLDAVMSMLQPDSQTPPVVIGTTNIPMPPSVTYARHFAAHFVEVEVDVETGEIHLLNYVATQDSGTVLNPKVLENQVIGGAIMGSGFALKESLAFDPETGRILNPGFLDYKVMRVPDFPLEPEVIFCESYDPVGPFGAKSAGEAPACAPIPAISQAVYNAIGVWMDIPMTPERVLEALGKI